MRKPIVSTVCALVAVSATVLSVLVERVGPEVASYGNLCGPSGNDDCLGPLLKGGFPFAYLFDVPGVSVQHQLSFGEDRFEFNAFLLDIAFYFIVVLSLLFARKRARRRPGPE